MALATPAAGSTWQPTASAAASYATTPPAIPLDPFAHLFNLRSALRENPSWGDRWNRLGWQYSGSRWFRRWFRRWSRPERQIAFRFAPPVGLLRLVVRDNDGSDAFVLSEVFQHRYYDIPLRSPPSTILDLGANVGFTTIFFARTYPKAAIACVEPMDSNLRLLRENLSGNAVNARVIAGAVSVASGTIRMQRAAKDYGHKVAGIGFGRALDGDTIVVAGLPLDEILRSLGWDRVDLLKIDIEGYEGVLFHDECAWLARVGTIFIECHEGFGEPDLRELAARHGFTSPRQQGGTWILERAAVL